MPIVPDPDHPHRRTLVDADGLPIARFTHVERDGRRVADLLELEVPVERAVPFVLAELRGMRVAGPEALGRALVAAGGTAARHATCTRTTCASGRRCRDGFDAHAGRPARGGAAARLPGRAPVRTTSTRR